MVTLFRRACIVVGAGFLVACQAKTAQFTPQDETTLRGMFDSTVAELNSGRWEAWASQYSSDAYLQPPNAPTVRGHDALLAWGKAFPAIEHVGFSDVQVTGEGNYAYGSSAYALKLKDAPEDKGKQLVVFRRSAAGKWEVAAASFNSDAPPAAPMPAKAQP